MSSPTLAVVSCFVLLIGAVLVGGSNISLCFQSASLCWVIVMSALLCAQQSFCSPLHLLSTSCIAIHFDSVEFNSIQPSSKAPTVDQTGAQAVRNVDSKWSIFHTLQVHMFTHRRSISLWIDVERPPKYSKWKKVQKKCVWYMLPFAWNVCGRNECACTHTHTHTQSLESCINLFQEDKQKLE